MTKDEVNKCFSVPSYDQPLDDALLMIWQLGSLCKFVYAHSPCHLLGLIALEYPVIVDSDSDVSQMIR
jgi:hypothetical protein